MNARAMSRGLPRLQPALFLLAAAAVYMISILIAGRLTELPDRQWLAIGVTLDLALTVPVLYYLFMVRGRGWPVTGVVPLFLVGLLTATRLLPADQQQATVALRWIAAPLELAIVGWIGYRAVSSTRAIRRSLRRPGYDAFTAIREAAESTVGPPVAGILAHELTLLYCALFSWKTPLPKSDRAFTSYKESSYGVLLAALSMAMFMEIVGVHLIVHLFWSPVAAWVLTALSVYGAVWLMGDFQALRLRPTLVTPDTLLLRLGMRAEVDLPRAAIRSVRVLSEADAQSVADLSEPKPLKLVLIGQPNLEIQLTGPVAVRWIMGLKREAQTLYCQIDDPQRLIAVLEEAAGISEVASEVVGTPDQPR